MVTPLETTHAKAIGEEIDAAPVAYVQHGSPVTTTLVAFRGKNALLDDNRTGSNMRWMRFYGLMRLISHDKHGTVLWSYGSCLPWPLHIIRHFVNP